MNIQTITKIPSHYDILALFKCWPLTPWATSLPTHLRRTVPFYFCSSIKSCQMKNFLAYSKIRESEPFLRPHPMWPFAASLTVDQSLSWLKGSPPPLFKWTYPSPTHMQLQLLCSRSRLIMIIGEVSQWLKPLSFSALRWWRKAFLHPRKSWGYE